MEDKNYNLDTFLKFFPEFKPTLELILKIFILIM